MGSVCLCFSRDKSATLLTRSILDPRNIVNVLFLRLSVHMVLLLCHCVPNLCRHITAERNCPLSHMPFTQHPALLCVSIFIVLLLDWSSEGVLPLGLESSAFDAAFFVRSDRSALT